MATTNERTTSRKHVDRFLCEWKTLSLSVYRRRQFASTLPYRFSPRFAEDGSATPICRGEIVVVLRRSCLLWFWHEAHVQRWGDVTIGTKTAGTRFPSVASTARSKQRRSSSSPHSPPNSFTFVSPFSLSRRSFETRDPSKRRRGFWDFVYVEGKGEGVLIGIWRVRRVSLESKDDFFSPPPPLW